jgi:hypothetical protein
MDGVNVNYDQDRNAYLVTVGDASESIVDRGKDFLAKYRVNVDKILATFGERLAKDLELTSTIAFLTKNYPGDEPLSDEQLAAKTKDLKPQYEDTRIREAIKELRDMEYLPA